MCAFKKLKTKKTIEIKSNAYYEALQYRQDLFCQCKFVLRPSLTPRVTDTVLYLSSLLVAVAVV